MNPRKSTNMSLMKRHLKHLNQAAFSAVAATALLTWTSVAHGQTGNSGVDAYPVRAIRLVVDVLQESARHLGHIDILRELIDGVRGE